MYNESIVFFKYFEIVELKDREKSQINKISKVWVYDKKLVFLEFELVWVQGRVYIFNGWVLGNDEWTLPWTHTSSISFHNLEKICIKNTCYKKNLSITLKLKNFDLICINCIKK